MGKSSKATRMTDAQMTTLLEALTPKEKPFLQKMSEAMAVTIFTGALTVVLFLGWNMYVNVVERVKKLESDSQATSTVFTDEIAQLRAKSDQISGLWEQVRSLREEINDLEKEHVANTAFPWSTPSPAPAPVPGKVVPPAPASQAPPPPQELVDPDVLFKGLQQEHTDLKWKLQQERDR